jgi:hypothetical protein
MRNIGAVITLAFATVFTVPASAITIRFQNNCGYSELSIWKKWPPLPNPLLAVWPAVGKAPNGQPDPSVAFGTTLGPGSSASFGVDNGQIVSCSVPLRDVHTETETRESGPGDAQAVIATGRTVPLGAALEALYHCLYTNFKTDS